MTELERSDEHGRFVRAAAGDRTWEIAPPAARWLVKTLAWTPAAALLAGIVAWLALAPRGAFFIFQLFGKGSLATLGAVGAAGSLLGRASHRLVAFQLRRLAGASAALGRRNAAGERWERIEGRVVAREMFRSAVHGRPAVMAHYSWKDEVEPRRELVRGVPFAIVSDEGDSVYVEPEEAYFIAPGRRLRGVPAEPYVLAAANDRPGRFLERILAPGDRVEAFGIRVAEIDGQAERAGDRQLPMRMVLRGTERLPVVVRRLRQ